MKVFATNKRARFDYDITETILAGIVLSGAETKSLRTGQASLRGSFIALQNGEAYLTNAHISPYAHAQQPDYDPTMRRKLLLHKRELDHLQAAKQSGLAIVALAIGAHGRYIKLEIGLGRGKKRYDKREALKDRDNRLDIARHVKRS